MPLQWRGKLLMCTECKSRTVTSCGNMDPVYKVACQQLPLSAIPLSDLCGQDLL